MASESTGASPVFHCTEVTIHLSVQELRELEAEVQSLKMQLVEAMEDASSREREHAAAEEELARVAGVMQQLLDQRALLYREYARMRDERAAEHRRLEEAARKAGEDAAEARAELELAHRQLSALRPISADSPTGADVARLAEELKERTRALVRSEVGAVRLGRRVALLEASEASLRRRNHECEVRRTPAIAPPRQLRGMGFRMRTMRCRNVAPISH